MDGPELIIAVLFVVFVGLLAVYFVLDRKRTKANYRVDRTITRPSEYRVYQHDGDRFRHVETVSTERDAKRAVKRLKRTR